LETAPLPSAKIQPSLSQKEGRMTPITVPKNLIAERAYEIFKSRGQKPGSALEDWLTAEKELAEQARQGATVPFQPKKPQPRTVEITSKSGKRSLSVA
jgi:hypothetical protein